MKEEKHRLILDGNAFYEIDLECIRKKEQNKKEDNKYVKKRQRK